MSALIILLGTRVRHHARPVEFVRVWCPYCESIHCHSSTCDGYGARCPATERAYYVRIAYSKVERTAAAETETVPYA
jgi:hypothetical protein